MLPDTSYKIYFEKKFQRILNGLPEDVKRAFGAKLDYFRNNPSHPSLNTKLLIVSAQKLKQLGVDQVYEFYVNRKDYRCVFYVIHKDKEIIIAFIGNHTQVRNKL
jgi:mRNA-degrading endonuclease RelE of RelBE toxin-antitoxin system